MLVPFSQRFNHLPVTTTPPSVGTYAMLFNMTHVITQQKRRRSFLGQKKERGS